MGRRAVFGPAVASTRNGQNIGGVWVMVKHPRKVRQIFPLGKCGNFFSKGRWIHAITEGVGGAGLHMFSVYGYDTGKPEHARLNMELDQEVFGAIAALDGAPWIVYRRRLEQDSRNFRRIGCCGISRLHRGRQGPSRNLHPGYGGASHPQFLHPRPWV
eukprot:3946016-Heterocapsa_arctica.AAC.1